MRIETPDFSTLARLEEAALGAKLEAVRALFRIRPKRHPPIRSSTAWSKIGNFDAWSIVGITLRCPVPWSGQFGSKERGYPFEVSSSPLHQKERSRPMRT